MKCSNCGGEVGNETIICQYCGEMISKRSVPVYCKSCGYPGRKGDKFCIQCGSPMGQQSMTHGGDQGSAPMDSIAVGQEQRGNNINGQGQTASGYNTGNATQYGFANERNAMGQSAANMLPNDTRKKSYIGPILGIGGGVLLLVAMIGGILFYRNWKARMQAKEEAKQYQTLYDGIEERFTNYIMTSQDEKKLKQYQKNLSGAIEELDIEKCKKTEKNLTDLEKGVEEYSEETVKNLEDDINEADTTALYTVERKELSACKKKAGELTESRQYIEAQEAYQECQNIIDIANAATSYQMDLMQVDVTDFPNVNLYLSIKDVTTDTALENLEPQKFSIKEKIKTGNYKTLDIEKAVQLDEEEGLNTAIVADVSASMGSGLLLAEDAMANFVQGLQYNVNDKAALYSFADTVYREQHFTGKQDVLEKAIYNMEMGNMTALYDALVYSISDIVVEQGAKCIIAFTDGMENNSNSSKSYVIDKARQYDIPIYIIGIGSSVDSYDLQDIAQETGGFYRNISDISSIESVYDEIYQAQKSMYLLQYTTQMKSKEKLLRQLYIRYQDDNYTVRTEAEYTPSAYKIDGYIFYDSDSRYLKEKELKNLSEEEVLIALNEIYARKGYLFQKNDFLIDHFNQCSWYHGKYGNQNKVSKKFNKYEKANVKLLVKYEKKHKLNNRK